MLAGSNHHVAWRLYVRRNAVFSSAVHPSTQDRVARDVAFGTNDWTTKHGLKNIGDETSRA